MEGSQIVLVLRLDWIVIATMKWMARWNSHESIGRLLFERCIIVIASDSEIWIDRSRYLIDQLELAYEDLSSWANAFILSWIWMCEYYSSEILVAVSMVRITWENKKMRERNGERKMYSFELIKMYSNLQYVDILVHCLPHRFRLFSQIITQIKRRIKNPIITGYDQNSRPNLNS
jgi:hypothetical protein